MKRTTRKLVVRGETIRALAARDLARVPGGGGLEDDLDGKSAVNCPAVALPAALTAACR